LRSLAARRDFIEVQLAMRLIDTSYFASAGAGVTRVIAGDLP